MEGLDVSTEAQVPASQWGVHTLSSGEQRATEAPLQKDFPFGQAQGQLGGFGQAASNQGPFSTAAPPEHSWEPQPAGVLNAPAWPPEVGSLQLIQKIMNAFLRHHTGPCRRFSRCQCRFA